MLGLRPFDVQLVGGMILHEGQIAEMRTGAAQHIALRSSARHGHTPLAAVLCSAQI